MRSISRIVLVLGLLAVMASASAQGRMQRGKLQQVQDAYAASIRWGDFENAWQGVDPAYREANPISDLEFERYKQVQISGYRDLSTRSGPDGTVEPFVRLDRATRRAVDDEAERLGEFSR